MYQPSLVTVCYEPRGFAYLLFRYSYRVPAIELSRGVLHLDTLLFYVHQDVEAQVNIHYPCSVIAIDGEKGLSKQLLLGQMSHLLTCLDKLIQFKTSPSLSGRCDLGDKSQC